MKTTETKRLTGGYQTPVCVDSETGDGGRRIQLEDVVRSEASRMSELTRSDIHGFLSFPHKVLVLSHEVDVRDGDVEFLQ